MLIWPNLKSGVQVSIAIVTENHMFGDLLDVVCRDNDLSVVGVFPNVASVNGIHPGDILIFHLAAGNVDIFDALQDLLDKFGKLEYIFVVPDQLSDETLARLGPIATILLAENMSAKTLISALTLAELGYHFLSPEAPTEASTQMPLDRAQVNTDAARLSSRELAVLNGVRNGQSNKHIALDLEIAEATVKVHLRSAFRKLGVSNRTQAALWVSSVN